METKLKQKSGSRAFSLVELLAVVAGAAIIGAIAVSVITTGKAQLEASKLEQDVTQLNTAVKVFLANGGDLEGVETANDVLTELKKSANAEGQEKIVGLRGSSIDNRLLGVDEGSGEVRPRAVWKEALGKFVIEDSDEGIAEFVLEESLASVDFGSQRHDAEEQGDRVRKTRLVYNDDAGWVWESLDFGYVTSTGPTAVPTINAPTLGASGGTGAGNSTRLGTPVITPGSGTFALSQFPLEVTITKDGGDPASAAIFYSVESGTWSIYSGPILVQPGTSIQAFSSTEDPSWDDSDPANATFNNDPEPLEIALSIPKNPITYVDAGGSLEDGDYTPVAPVAPISVSLPAGSNIPDVYENSDNFRVYWTYDGSDPRSSSSRHGGNSFSGGYAGDAIDYTLPQWDGATLLPIQIVAQSSNPSVVTNSPVLSTNIGISRMNLRPPVIDYAENTERGDTVDISKLVDYGDMPVGARIYYTTDGTDPGTDGNGNPLTGTLYTGPFDPLANDEEATEATIVARVYPPQQHPAWFNVSSPSNSSYSVVDWEISGTASGWFSHAVGPSGMVSNIWGNQTNSYFQWGNPGNWGTGANWLEFTGSAFDDVSADEQFQIGQLSYYNGTISMSSLATAVDFAVQLAFGGANAQFDYTFDLLTTPNTGSAWENADYVWFNDTASAQNVSLYGADYSLNLEFGETTTDGFSTIDQFHVKESKSATANLYATLVSLGSWW